MSLRTRMNKIANELSLDLRDSYTLLLVACFAWQEIAEERKQGHATGHAPK